MLGQRSFLGVLFAVVLAQPASAEPATQEGADKLLDTFQTYLGKPAAGETGSLTVKPDGDAYIVSFDLQTALKPFEASGLKVDPATITMHVASQADGNYHVFDLKLPPVGITAKDASKVAYSFDGVAFDGIFDPKIAGFSKSETKFGKIAYEQVAPTATAHVVESDINGQQSATQASAGVATIQQHYTIGSISEIIGMPGQDSTAVNVAVGPAIADVGIVGLHNQAFYDLLAFFVSHQGQDKIVADAGTLKSQLSALLPVFDKIDETIKFTDFAVTTPMGKISLGEFGFKLAATGAVEQGAYSIALTGAKPGYPAGLLQPWQVNLIPTDFSIGADMAGLNADAAAKQLIAGLDPAGKDGPFPASVTMQAVDALWAGGPLKVTFAPSHINAATYQLSMSGDATINRNGPPSLHMLVNAKGLDATIDALGTVKQTDPAAGQAVVMLATAKGLGKANPDGTMSWDVQFGADGVLTVNGAKLGK